MSVSNNSNSSENSVDLIDLMIQIWKDKYYILLIIVSFVAFSIFQLNNATFTYDIYFKVTPSTQMSSSQDNSRFIGLASIIGLSTPQSSTGNEFEMYKTIIVSRIVSNALALDKQFIENYSKEEDFDFPKDLLEKKFITIVDESWRSVLKNFLGLPSHTKRVTLEDLVHKKITSKISVSTDTISNITTVNFKSINPDFGIKLLKKVHEIADNELKKRSLKRTSDYISFLNEQLLKTTKQDQRLSLISTLAEQQRSRMIASSDLSYAADLFGNLVGVIIAIIIFYFFKKNENFKN